MARNSEKAQVCYLHSEMLIPQSMLYRFREQQAAERGLINTTSMRRPKNITQVDSIPVAEKWRGQVIRQISRAVTKIQDRIILPLSLDNGLIGYSKFIGLPDTRFE
jgi:pre-mRNA-splicing factor ISY1